MKKETGIAVFLGILAGISIAIFVIFGTRGQQKTQGTLMQSDLTPTVSVVTQEVSPLTLSAPSEDAVTESSTVTVKGSAQKDALVVIQSPGDEEIFRNTEKNFAKEITLIPGENIIKVTTYSLRNIDSRSVVIYFIKE